MMLGGAQAAVTPCTSNGPVVCPNIVMYGTPALGVLSDTLWLVYRGDSAGTLWVTFYSDNTVDGGMWTTPVPFSTYFDSIVSSSSPALASFNGQLYLAYTGVDSSGSPQVCYRSGGSPGSSGSFSSTNQTCLIAASLPHPVIVGSPSLAASDSTLWLTYRQTGDSRVDNASGVWVTGLLGTRQGETHQLTDVSINSTGSPSVADFNGQPYVCFTSLLGSTPTCDGLDGTSAPVATVAMGGSPAVVAFNGQFYLVHQASGLLVNYSLRYATSTNPTNPIAWSWDLDMQIGHVIDSPAVAVYHNRLYWAAPTDNQQVLFGAIDP
jgi:hypothetical protein